MKQTIQPMTHTEALNEYYGGIQGIARQPLPFKCRCGKSYFEATKTDDGMKIKVQMPVMTVADIWKHIRKFHKERIKKEAIQ